MKTKITQMKKLFILLLLLCICTGITYFFGKLSTTIAQADTTTSKNENIAYNEYSITSFDNIHQDSTFDKLSED